MTDHEPRFFHRIVRTNPPTLDDFTSNAALGKRAPVDPEEARLWDGLSVYSTFNQARRKSMISPILGRYVATLRVPVGGVMRVERTRGEGHHTLWGEPAELLGLIVEVRPV